MSVAKPALTGDHFPVVLAGPMATDDACRWSEELTEPVTRAARSTPGVLAARPSRDLKAQESIRTSQVVCRRCSTSHEPDAASLRRSALNPASTDGTRPAARKALRCPPPGTIRTKAIPALPTAGEAELRLARGRYQLARAVQGGQLGGLLTSHSVGNRTAGTRCVESRHPATGPWHRARAFPSGPRSGDAQAVSNFYIPMASRPTVWAHRREWPARAPIW